MRWLFILLLGAGLGAVAAASNAAADADPTPTVRALSLVANLGTLWAAVAVLGGWVLAKVPWSVLAGPIVLVSAVSGYFLWGAATGTHVTTFGDLSGQAQLVMIAAVLMAPLFGLLGGVARTGSRPGILARIVIPVALSVEIMVRYPLSNAEYSADPLMAWTSTGLLVVGVLGAMMAVVSAQTSQ